MGHKVKHGAADQAANEIILRLRSLPSPKDAALALAIVQAQLCIQAGGMTETRVRKMLSDSHTGALQAWSMFTGTELAQ